MLLHGGLYTILSSAVDVSSALFSIELNPAHVIFAAHFPGEPILPGACIVQIATELFAQWKDDDQLQVRKISNLKFLSIVSPQQLTNLDVLLEERKTDAEGTQVRVSVRNVDVEYSRMTLLFTHDL